LGVSSESLFPNREALAVEAPRFEKEKEAGLRRILSSQHHLI